MPPAGPAAAAPVELHVLPVQGNISMIVGDGGNITMSVGEDGILLVDTGLAANADKLLEFIRTIAPGKPLRYIINTHVHADHTGGNEKLGPAWQHDRGRQRRRRCGSWRVDHRARERPQPDERAGRHGESRRLLRRGRPTRTSRRRRSCTSTASRS